MEEIRKELTRLKCIVCNKYLSIPPVYYTPSGDYRCGRCSFVKDNLSFKADLFEKMGRCVTFPCIYQDCDAEIPWSDVPDHEANCKKRMIECPFDCDYFINMKDLVQHFDLVHGNLKLTRRKLVNESVLKDGEQVKMFYVVSESEPFVVMFVPNNEEFKFGSTSVPNFNSETSSSKKERKKIVIPSTLFTSHRSEASVTSNSLPTSSSQEANPCDSIGRQVINAGNSKKSCLFSLDQSISIATDCPKFSPSIPKQSGLSVFSFFPGKPLTFSLSFTSSSWKADIREQKVEPFISKDHCRKCWIKTCKNKLHNDYFAHVDIDEYQTTKFKSGVLSKLFQNDDVTFSIIVHNKPIIDEKQKSLFVDLSRVVQKYLECPICNHTMVPPISVCSIGHTICTACRLFLNDCPTCKAPYTGTRNFVLEELYETSVLICSASNNFNCNFIGTVDEVSKHDKCHDSE